MGTPYYMAPEVWGFNSDKTMEFSDTWSIGVILFKIVTGKFPFNQTS